MSAGMKIFFFMTIEEFGLSGIFVAFAFIRQRKNQMIQAAV